MGHEQMLRVSRVERWLARHGAAEAARPGLRDPGECVVIRPNGGLPGGSSPITPEGPPGGHGYAHQAGEEDCRRSGRDQNPDGSGPSSGARALRLHLALMPPGTRGGPHRHDLVKTAVYLVSGQAECWHGPELGRRSTVRAGDCLYIPPGAPHLVVNQGDVTAIAVITRTEIQPQAGNPAAAGPETVPVELPRQLSALLTFPVGSE
jgi:uncharacterized RmlC-like cupin family protein